MEFDDWPQGGLNMDWQHKVLMLDDSFITTMFDIEMSENNI